MIRKCLPGSQMQGTSIGSDKKLFLDIVATKYNKTLQMDTNMMIIAVAEQGHHSS